MAETRRRRLVVVTPTLKASQVAARELGTSAFSAAWLIHQHGYRWDDDGRRTREPASRVPLAATLRRGDILLVDEAGMLDQDTALALFTIADEARARVVLVGDRHQLPAVGRGGVLDHACDDRTGHRQVEPRRRPSLRGSRVRRAQSADAHGVNAPERSSTASWPAVSCASTPPTSSDSTPSPTSQAWSIADTRDQVATLNAAIRARRIGRRRARPRRPDDDDPAGQTIGVGDQIATRRNDAELGVANRETWTVTRVHDDGALEVATADRRRVLPRDYALTLYELAYASTAYGAQGQTVDTAHVLVSDHSGAAATYVGMSRGEAATSRTSSPTPSRTHASNGPAPSPAIAPTWVRPAHDSGLDDIERYGIAPAARRPRLNVGSDAPQRIDAPAR